MNPCSSNPPALAGEKIHNEVAGGRLIYGAVGSCWRSSTKNRVLFLLLLTFAFAGCDQGDVKKAAGNYEVTVVDPNGRSDVGSATVSNSGDFFSIVINSSVGNFAVAGTLNNNVIQSEFTDSSGAAASARFQFSVDRSTFTGTIQTTPASTTTTTEGAETTTVSTQSTSGLYVIRGTKLSPLT